MEQVPTSAELSESVPVLEGLHTNDAVFRVELIYTGVALFEDNKFDYALVLLY